MAMTPKRRLFDLLAPVDPLEPLWDDVDLLVSELRTIAAAKLKEREQLGALKEALGELSNNFSVQLDYFGFNHFLKLKEQPTTAISKFVAEIRDLIQQLDSHSKFDLSASDVTQARQKRKDLDQIEANILDVLNSLDSQLTELGGGNAQLSSSNLVDQSPEPNDQSISVEQLPDSKRMPFTDESAPAIDVSKPDEPARATTSSKIKEQNRPNVVLAEFTKLDNKLATKPNGLEFNKTQKYPGPQTALTPQLSFSVTGNKSPIFDAATMKQKGGNRSAHWTIDRMKGPASLENKYSPQTPQAFVKPEEPQGLAATKKQTKETNEGELSSEIARIDEAINLDDAVIIDVSTTLSSAALHPITEKIEQGEAPNNYLATQEVKSDSPSPIAKLHEKKELIAKNQATISVEGKSLTSTFQDRTWQLLESDDIAGAYWSEIASRGTSWSTNLLSSLQASRWMTAGSAQFADDLLEITQLDAHEDSTLEESLLRFAAALVPSLIAPTSGMVAWLNGAKLPPPLLKFSSDLARFAQAGILLEPFELLQLQGSVAHGQAVQEISSRATRWLNDAPNKTTKFWRTSRIWIRLTERGGALHEMLLPVSTNDARGTDQVREALSLWGDRNFACEQIEQIDRLRAASNTSPLPGSARDQLIRFIQEACSLCLEWVRAIESTNARQTDWTTQQIQELKTKLHEWEPILLEITEQYSQQTERDLRISGIQLGKSISHLFTIFGLRTTDPAERAPWSLDLSNLVRTDLTLEAALCKRLLIESSARLSDDGKPILAWLNTANFEQSPQGALELLHTWITRLDFRFIDQVLSACDFPDFEVQKVRELQQKKIETAKETLRATLVTMLDLIERAVIDGLIAEERSEFLAELEQIDVESTANFCGAFELLQDLEGKLKTARNSRASYIADSWAQLRTEARERGLRIPENTYALIQNAVNDGDVRVADEAMSILRLEIEAGIFSSDSTPSSQEALALKSFWVQLPKLAEYLKPNSSLKSVIHDLRRHHLKPSIFPIDLTDDCRIRGADILDAVRLLKEEGPRCLSLKARTVSIFDWLGFNFSDDAADSVSVQKTDGANYTYLNAKMSVGQHSPVPLFGSGSANRYDVILLWNHFEPNQYATLIQELKITDRPLLVLYFGRLDQSQRILLRKESHKLDLPGLVIDETLILFLISAENRRLQTFFECSLPFGRNNPYAPFKIVPPEMFFGRQEAARSLQSPAGTCLVFGGRQLGKSALLQHVQREFDRPEMEHYAWVLDIQTVGNPKSGQPASSIWVKLRDKMQEHNLLSNKLYSIEPERVWKSIKDALHAVPHRRVIVMFDEADNFLNADATAAFSEVGRLRSLMVETDGRIKVIFAGLHNVQRFQGIPNQPLAHFGMPICIGPLEPASAIQLIRRPLAVLGFEFETDSCVHKILSYTNYHPGLIQLFGQELLHSLRQHNINQLPATITAADVEAVYKDSETRNAIRERFELTLSLDNRYQAVAYAIIVDQIRSNNTFSKSYSAAQLLGILRFWLPAIFENQSLDEFRGILDEMAGLGVLSGATSGYYRLRSPNLVRLMGTELDIENKLFELASKPIETQFDADAFHPIINASSKVYSPFTNGQERALNAPRFGVLLVHGSEATGLAQATHALSKFAPLDCPSVIQIPEQLTGEGLTDWFKKTARNRDTAEKIFCHRTAPDDPLHTAELVRTSIEFCREQRVRNKLLRIIILFSPSATAAWCELPLALRQQLENEADSVMCLKPWNEGGIQHRLEFEGKSLLPDVFKQVALATGGWPTLLDEVIKRSSKTDDPRPAAKAIQAELIEGTLKSQLRLALGIPFAHHVDLVWQFIKSEAPVENTLVIPELIDESLSTEQCGNAIALLERLSLINTTTKGIVPDPTISLIW